jgi:tetraacyldisaccharide 4'-kinase
LGKIWIGLASGVWSFLSQTARASSKAGLLKSTRLDSKVISVGNIQVGGAGKTPLVAQIANEAIQRGHSVCILTRGYKSVWELKGGIIPPGTQSFDAAQCGDEATLLHELCPGAYVGVGADRVKQFQEVLAHSQKCFHKKIDITLLDDGFQHWAIQKDIEVVALTSAKNNAVLFRDSIHALRNADLLVWTKGDERPVPVNRPLVVVNYRLPRPSESQQDQDYCLITGLANGQHVLS